MAYQDEPKEKTRCTKEEEDQLFILSRGELTDWERKFCATLEKYKMWTEKQRAIFQKVRDKYLSKTAAPDEDTF